VRGGGTAFAFFRVPGPRFAFARSQRQFARRKGGNRKVTSFLFLPPAGAGDCRRHSFFNRFIDAQMMPGKKKKEGGPRPPIVGTYPRQVLRSFRGTKMERPAGHSKRRRPGCGEVQKEERCMILFLRAEGFLVSKYRITLHLGGKEKEEAELWQNLRGPYRQLKERGPPGFVGVGRKRPILITMPICVFLLFVSSIGEKGRGRGKTLVDVVVLALSLTLALSPWRFRESCGLMTRSGIFGLL